MIAAHGEKPTTLDCVMAVVAVVVFIFLLYEFATFIDVVHDLEKRVSAIEGRK